MTFYLHNACIWYALIATHNNLKEHYDNCPEHFLREASLFKGGRTTNFERVAKGEGAKNIGCNAKGRGVKIFILTFLVD